MRQDSTTRTLGGLESRAAGIGAIVSAMEVVGPDVAKIAGATGLPVETVRHTLEKEMANVSLVPR